MKKHGFTLAEVLITLGIVGVVAALTIPGLMQNVGGAKIGPQLAKFVNTFEVAAETAKNEEGYNTLSAMNAESTDGDTTILGVMSKYMIMTKVPKSTITHKIYSPDGESSDSVDAANTWQLKDGTLLTFVKESSLKGDEKYKASGSYKGAVAALIVDFGGLDGKHRAGKEIFKFIVDNNGTLIPYGGMVHIKLANLEKNPPKCQPSGTSSNQGYACTGAFADNGYKTPKNY